MLAWDRDLNLSACAEYHSDLDIPSLTLQSAAACLLGQLGQQGVTFDLQPVEWIAAATHALSAPAEVRLARNVWTCFL